MPSSRQWFHIPLPTPVLEADKRLSLARIFLLWRIIGDGSLEFVHLYDGGRFVTKKYKNHEQAGYEGHLGFSGDHSQVDGESTFELERPSVNASGYGISFQVQADAYAHGQFIDFSKRVQLFVYAAGADYFPAD
jgi:hypothetical protein